MSGQSCPARQPARLRGDAGFSLPEMLITIAILGIAFVGILAALATLIRTSADQRTHADANAVLVSAVEAVKSAGFVADCTAAGTSYSAAAQSVEHPQGWAAGDIHVQVTDCGDPQHVLVGVTAPDGSYSDGLMLAKMDAASVGTDPTTTTTTPSPPPPGPSSCDPISAGAWSDGESTTAWLFIEFADEDDCDGLRAGAEGSSSTVALWGFSRWGGGPVPVGTACRDGSCRLVVYDAGGTVVTTVDVDVDGD